MSNGTFQCPSCGEIGMDDGPSCNCGSGQAMTAPSPEFERLLAQSFEHAKQGNTVQEASYGLAAYFAALNAGMSSDEFFDYAREARSARETEVGDGE